MNSRMDKEVHVKVHFPQTLNLVKMHDKVFWNFFPCDEKVKDGY